MNDEIACEAVKDLLPNYTDKLTSEKTNQILEKHFINCPDCAKERDNMKKTLELDKVPENTDLKRFLRKTKNMYLLKGVMLSLGILAIIVSFIVDIAVNHKLTWSIIVDVSIILFYAVMITAVLSKKNRIINGMAVFTVLILPMFYIMEYVINVNYVTKPVYWVGTYGLPITAIWLIIIWIAVLMIKFTKLNIWTVLGIILLFAIFGSALTNIIASQVSLQKLYRDSFEWINSLAYFGCALVCFVVGYIRKGKNR